MGEDLIARVHRRLFLDEWNYFVDLCSRTDPSSLTARQLEDHMIRDRSTCQLSRSDNHCISDILKPGIPRLPW